MATEQRKTRGELRAMFWHDFLGSLADNMVEVNWMLVVTLFPVMVGTDDIVAMFGLTDTVWVVLSILYYAARMGLNAFMPQFMVGRDAASASMPLKNAWYLTMLTMAPLVLLTAIFTEPIMAWLGAPRELLPLYCNYFRVGLVSIYLACPAGVLIPAYLRATFQNKTAMMLDHAVTWSMAAGCWFTVHILHEGSVVMMLVALLAHSIPTVWFLLTRPIPGFFARGLEWDSATLRHMFDTAKWEVVRRFLPRSAGVFMTASLMALSPQLVAAKYIIDQLASFLNGCLDSASLTALSTTGHNLGLGIKGNAVFSDHGYIARTGQWAAAAIGFGFWITSSLWAPLFAESQVVIDAVSDPVVWLCVTAANVIRVRYYVLLSITRAAHRDLNGFAMTSFAVIASVATPLATVVFLDWMQMGLLAVYLTGAVVPVLQILVLEWKLRRHNITIREGVAV